MQYKVSVIIPVYNASGTLKQCLDSVISQTLDDIEIIIVNDGSTDDSENIINDYLKDDRVIYYKKENEGLAAARQDGIERARGEFIGFVDSDDWIEPDMYEKMYQAAVTAGADVAFCNVFADEDEKERKYLETGVYDRTRIEDEILPRSLGGISKKGANDVIRWSNCLRIYRKKLLDDNSIKFDRRFRRSQDLQLTFESMIHANRFVYLGDDYLYHNRTRNNGQSLSRGYTKNYWNLIRPLIDVLQSDVENYKKHQDLSYNMALCVFFFAVAGIINESKDNGNSRKVKLEKIEQISDDEAVRKSLPLIEHEKLNSFYREIYLGLVSGKPKNILKRYENTEHITLKKRVKKCISAFINIPVVEKAYIWIRDLLKKIIIHLLIV